MTSTLDPTPICDYENSTYRTDFWEGQGREYEDLAERIAIRRLLPAQVRRLLDIGAGFGRLANLYAAYEHVVLLDYSQSQLAYARQQLGDERFTYIAADLYKLPLADNAVDALVMVRVMHHLANVPLAFNQLHRVLIPGGSAIIEFANKKHLKNILRRIARRGPDPFQVEPYEFAPLHYDFHPRWIRQRLHEAGFTPHQTLSVSLFRANALKKRIDARFLAKLDGLQQRALAPLAIAPSIFTLSTTPKADNVRLASFQSMLICPACDSSNLARYGDKLHCTQCGSNWPIVDGVYVFK